MDDLIVGQVVSGHGVGRELGFPTVNVEYAGDLRGVYAGYFSVDGDSERFRAAVNVGARPSFQDSKVGVEAFLVDLEDFSIEKGVVVRIELKERLREVQKFENLSDLKAQISKDVTKVRELL